MGVICCTVVYGRVKRFFNCKYSRNANCAYALDKYTAGLQSKGLVLKCVLILGTHNLIIDFCLITIIDRREEELNTSAKEFYSDILGNVDKPHAIQKNVPI